MTNIIEEIAIVRRSIIGDIKALMINLIKSPKIGVMINQRKAFKTKLKLKELKKKLNTRLKGHSGRLRERKNQLS